MRGSVTRSKKKIVATDFNGSPNKPGLYSDPGQRLMGIAIGAGKFLHLARVADHWNRLCGSDVVPRNPVVIEGGVECSAMICLRRESR